MNLSVYWIEQLAEHQKRCETCRLALDGGKGWPELCEIGQVYANLILREVTRSEPRD